jgi:exodeoxyribonuclease VII large subunit
VNQLFGEPTYTIAQLGEEVRLFLGEAFPAVWVAGEVQRLRASRRGHLYFELVEKGSRDEVVGRIDAVLWRTDRQRIEPQLARAGERLEEGLEIRCRGRVDFYPPGGRLQLVVSEIDPTFTLGLLARRRQETLAALAAAGLLEANARLHLPALPLRVALVTSAGSAAYHDFLATLAESGYPFAVTVFDVAVQGAEAERQVAKAIEEAGGLAVDCVALVRGGGARTDLAAFDSRRIAEAVARCMRPVVTGLGHQIDEAIADRVAHTALKTPTKVAEFLVERVAEAERRVTALAGALSGAARERLHRQRRALVRGESTLWLAAGRLRQEQQRLRQAARLLVRLSADRLRRGRRRSHELGRRLVAAPVGCLRRGDERAAAIGRRLVRWARRRLREAERWCGERRRLCSELSPERLLERGFSITRTVEGVLLRRPDQVERGEIIESRLAEGRLISRVERR